jgi:hypothetical protein
MVSMTRIDTSTSLIDVLSGQMKRKVSLLLDRKQDEERNNPLDKTYVQKRQPVRDLLEYGTESERCDRNRNSTIYRTFRENGNMNYLVRVVYVVSSGSVIRQVSIVVVYEVYVWKLNKRKYPREKGRSVDNPQIKKKKRRVR